MSQLDGLNEVFRLMVFDCPLCDLCGRPRFVTKAFGQEEGHLYDVAYALCSYEDCGEHCPCHLNYRRFALDKAKKGE